MSPAQRLRALMRWRGIHSQNQLARLSGVPQSCIHRILTRDEHYAPSRATLLRLAKALDTTVPWLSDGVVSVTEFNSNCLPAPATPAVPAAAPDDYCAEIGALLQSQPDSTKKAVLSMVRLLAERQPPDA
ncbi:MULTISPECIES: helix-turn-helix domain-containing protein [Achromobacter]|uniref:Helix-turn-helix transcriptional regulator n=1 Tax=Achromobacter spanius TaxID=217203 RepID=A0ABY8GPM0_9BURK|nr:MULTISPECIES: helix-turn-helix transcriptional regulator [Achromobacter]WAI84024.1 helix-turn-helix domain-containing protein [Achromobacter spanius]WEX94106.1 helix-turn-helix domain-containing protein [Achromobacter sp. SS2-2022]WFP06732.1 helix-turn-helix transcriptional regulator [Achromobacter spanius]